MTPEGKGRISAINFPKTGALISVALTTANGRVKYHFRPHQVRPILKGFQDFRNEAINGLGDVVTQVVARITAKVGPSVLTGLFELPLPDYVASTPGLESPMHFEGNDLIEATDLGNIRITETLEVFWQPKSKGKYGDLENGWLPLHLAGLTPWLVEQGYAAEMPVTEFMSPAFAQLLQDNAQKRKAFFDGFSSN